MAVAATTGAAPLCKECNRQRGSYDVRAAMYAMRRDGLKTVPYLKQWYLKQWYLNQW